MNTVSAGITKAEAVVRQFERRVRRGEDVENLRPAYALSVNVLRAISPGHQLLGSKFAKAVDRLPSPSPSKVNTYRAASPDPRRTIRELHRNSNGPRPPLCPSGLFRNAPSVGAEDDTVICELNDILSVSTPVESRPC